MKIYNLLRLAPLLAFSIFFSGPSDLLASGNGLSGGDILSFNPDPEAISMGGGLTADIADSPLSVFSNPARLMGLSRQRLSFSYSLLPGEIRSNFGSYAIPTQFGNMGISVFFLDYGDIHGYDTSLTPLSVSAYDSGFLLSYSYPIKKSEPIYHEYGSLGFSLKFLHENLYQNSAEAVAADIGGIVNVPSVQNLTFGAVYRNLGSQLKILSRFEDLPKALAFGFAYDTKELRNLIVTLDCDLPDKGSVVTSCGISISPVYFLALRAGLSNKDDSIYRNVRMGFGLNYNDFSVDYAFSNVDTLDPVHNLSINIPLGNFLTPQKASDYYLDQHFRKASEYFYAGNYIMARKEFEDILSVYPNHQPSQGYLKKIIANLETIDAQNERRIETWLVKAKSAYARKDFISARNYYNDVLEFSPKDEIALLGIENIKGAMADVEQERVKKKKRDEIERMYKNAVALYKSGEFIDAKAEFNKILEIDHDNQTAKERIVEIDDQLAKISANLINELYDKATRFYAKGRYAQAKTYFEAVSIAAPYRVDASDFIKRCDEKIAEERTVKAEEDKIKKQDKVIKEVRSAYYKALDLYKLGEYEEALNYFEKTRDLVKQYQFKEEDYATANYIENIQNLVSEKYYKKGFQYFSKNDFNSAIAEYRKALKFNPDHSASRIELKRTLDTLADSYYEKAMSSVSFGEYEKALTMINKALDYSPDKQEAIRAKQRILRSLGQ
jgi:tetratricopeptide (TPR) repeat protein